MESTGIVRRIDDLGRIVIPREIRNRNGIGEGDPLEIFNTADGILLRRYAPNVSASSLHPIIIQLKEEIELADYKNDNAKAALHAVEEAYKAMKKLGY